MRGRADPGRPVDVHPHVARALDHRLAGVECHSHAKRDALRPVVRRDRPLRLDGAAERVDRARERDEEGVALGIDLEPVPLLERGAQHLTLLGEQIRVFLPEAFQQPRRALDVGEQECDRAGRDP